MKLQDRKTGREKVRGKRYSWWGYVRSIVREYHELYGIPIPDGVTKRNCDAVQMAIDLTERMEGGENRLKLIRLMHWDKTHTLDGAAMDIPCSRRTAAYWQREFFEMVARNRGLLD